MTEEYKNMAETCAYLLRRESYDEPADFVMEMLKDVQDYENVVRMMRGHEHAAEWENHWRVKHGKSTLTFPGWGELLKDWAEQKALADSRLRRMRLFKERSERLRIELRKAQHERDCAINDFYFAGSDGGDFCQVCKYNGDKCEERKFKKMECWKWRGPLETNKHSSMGLQWRLMLEGEKDATD